MRRYILAPSFAFAASAINAKAQEISSLTLIDATTEQPIPGYDPLPGDFEIDLNSIGTNEFNIVANTTGAVGSVRFGYDQDTNFRTENSSPFAFFGDSFGDFLSWTPSLGAHTITATAYSASSAGGDVLSTANFSFNVVDSDGSDGGDGDDGGDDPISEGTQISVTVPVLDSADSGTEDFSRPAVFNWTFESENGGEAIVGQYACGSYWIAPANGDSSVRIISLTGSGNPGETDLLSIDTDPVIENTGLLDGSNNYGNYDDAEDELPQLPKSFTPEQGSCISLVAAMQRNEDETSSSGTRATNGESTDAYNIITLLPEPPSANDGDHIRPNITGASKTFYHWDDLDFSSLKESAIFPALSSDELEDIRIRWSHNIGLFGFGAIAPDGSGQVYSEGGRAYRAHILADEYASGTAAGYANDLLSLLNAHNTMEEKKPALAALLVYGLDIFNCRYNYGTGYAKQWTSGAGQWMGNFTPVVTAAMFTADEGDARPGPRSSGLYPRNRH